MNVECRTSDEIPDSNSQTHKQTTRQRDNNPRLYEHTTKEEDEVREDEENIQIRKTHSQSRACHCT